MKIEGFDFDNSPVTLARHADRIRTAKAVMTTTNGTNLLIKLQKNSNRVLIGSLLNLTP